LSRKRFPDHYSRKAKARAYPARSVFKLEEIDRRVGLLGKGDTVLDLGCAPGSWLKYASRRVGRSGCVIGVDLSQVRIPLPSNASVIEGDVFEIGPDRLARGIDGFDVVVSDMAPSTSGAALVDQEGSFRLLDRALDLAAALLLPGGRFAGKLFFSPRHEEVVGRMKELFSRVRTLRPRATRTSSREVFVAGLGFRR
jgi:23S rRNA (uridine2552-2'-O)-methyltransferase